MPKKKRSAERFQTGNPYELTRAQHVHSRRCIERFGDQVSVRLRDGRCFDTGPNNHVFTVDRVWSQKLERGLFCGVENSFQPVADEIVGGSIPADFMPVLKYLAIWRIRSDLARNPPVDLKLDFWEGGERKPLLTKDQEERLEAHGRVHGRDMGIGLTYLRGDTIPGRLACEVSVQMQFDSLTRPMRLAWKILRSTGKRFICPDGPIFSKLYMPLSPTVAVLALHEPGTVWEVVPVTDAQVEQLNRCSVEGCQKLVFGAVEPR